MLVSEPVAPSSLNRAIPARWNSLILAMLAKDPLLVPQPKKSRRRWKSFKKREGRAPVSKMGGGGAGFHGCFIRRLVLEASKRSSRRRVLPPDHHAGSGKSRDCRCDFARWESACLCQCGWSFRLDHSQWRNTHAGWT